MAEGIERTRELTQRVVGKCLPNADRLSNATKSLIDKVMNGKMFENASALGVLQWLLCTDDLKNLVETIPPWWYDGDDSPGGSSGPGGQTVTDEQRNFFERITSVPGTESLFDKLRTLQFGSDSASLVPTPTFSDTLTHQQSELNDFKDHTDQQSGVGDPTTFQRTIGIASAYDSAKQQMEGENTDNFTQFFNSTIQGPIIIEQMRNLLCVPDSLGQILRNILELIASTLPFTLDDIMDLLGGRTLDGFFQELDLMLSQIAAFFEYLNYIFDLDLSRFSLAQAYVQKFTLGQFLASALRGNGRGNCITRGILEEFTGSDNLRDAITAIDIERDKEERATAAASQAVTESGKEKALALENTDKEIFFKPVDDALILQGVVTGPPLPPPPPIDEATAALIQSKLLTLDSRTMYLGYRVTDLQSPDGGYFNEDASGGPDSVVPVDSVWNTNPPVSDDSLGEGEDGDGYST